jgi:hypothetical protein
MAVAGTSADSIKINPAAAVRIYDLILLIIF